jgi:hypothetical protein
MTVLNQEHYALLAQELVNAMGAEARFFNGSVEIATEEFSGRLRSTLIIHRTAGAITDITPVWCELETTGKDGDRSNDFGWSELKRALLCA